MNPMQKKLFKKDPVIIFGVGGSGTRIMAKLLSELNYYIGNDLNEALDNMTFTFLFRRPSWFFNQSIKDKNEIIHGLNILINTMKGNFIFLINKAPFYKKAGNEKK